MESFGFWYKLDENIEKNAVFQNDEYDKVDSDFKTPKFELHVNFWFLGDIVKHTKKYPYLDIGIKVINYRALSDLVFSFPFELEKDKIVDLAPKMADKNNASIIFNEECEIETQKEYTIINSGKENDEKLLIYPLSQAVENISELSNYENKSYLTIKFDKFKKYLKNTNDNLNKYSNLYIRFRIKEIDLQNILYFDSEPFNKSLDSAFSGTRVLDFKINEKRNIDKSITARMELQKEILVKFEQVHFLVMEPSSYDMISYTQNQMTCRELENNLWNEYLDVDLENKYGHILAYHWKEKAKEDKGISDFSCFAKINYQKMQMQTVLAYVLVILGLGVIGSTIVSATPLLNEFFSCSSEQYILSDLEIDIGLGVVMVFGGWILGKNK